MADGFLNALGGDQYEVKSAGLEAHGRNPRAVQVMKEAGVDISINTSDVIDPETLNRATYVNPNVIKWHWGFDDPAKATGTEDEIMAQFRMVCDSIKTGSSNSVMKASEMIIKASV
jgi:arsenate reductase (thioredoxin)